MQPLFDGRVFSRVQGLAHSQDKPRPRKHWLAVVPVCHITRAQIKGFGNRFIARYWLFITVQVILWVILRVIYLFLSLASTEEWRPLIHHAASPVQTVIMQHPSSVTLCNTLLTWTCIEWEEGTGQLGSSHCSRIYSYDCHSSILFMLLYELNEGTI